MGRQTEALLAIFFALLAAKQAQASPLVGVSIVGEAPIQDTYDRSAPAEWKPRGARTAERIEALGRATDSLSKVDTVRQEHPRPPNIGHCITRREREVCDQVNAYRRSQGLPDAPISKSLSTVAQYHAWDTIAGHPFNEHCSLHSWSGHMPSLWSPFCYKRDHSQAEAMWKKPSELTKYNSSGFEVSFWSSHGADAHGALRGWRGSKSHDDIIAEKDAWAGVKWPAMGCGLYKGGAILEVLDGTGLFFERDVQKLIREIAITDSLSRFPSSLLPAIFTNSEAAHCWFGKVKDSDGWPDVCDENS